MLQTTKMTATRIIKKTKPVPGDWKINLFLLILTAGFGAASALSSGFTSILWACLLVYSLYAMISGKIYQIWYCIAVSPQLEILTKISQNKKMPDEIAKYYLYIVIVMLYISLFDKRNKYLMPKHRLGIFLLGAIAPSLIYAAIYAQFDIKFWIFNISGIVQLAILLLFAARERWSEEEFYKLAKFTVLLSPSILVYLSLKTPKFSEISFETTANFATTGSFGPNQVSTALGASLFVIAILLILNKNAFNYVLVNLVLIGLLLFRGLITFSRGGVVVSILAVVLSIVIYAVKDRKTFRNYFAISLASVFFLSGIFFVVNKMTHSALLQRYQGKKTGEAHYAETNSLNKLTANRQLIAYTDIGIFVDHLVFGVGPGEARYYRKAYGGFDIIAHTEYTRLLSEHGLGGLAVVLLLTFFPVAWVRKIKDRKIKAVCAGMFLLAVGNTFHAATRTNNFVIYFVLASMPVVFREPKTKSKFLTAGNDAFETGITPSESEN